MKLKGKVALVTGAGSGFGEGIARHFAAEGAKLVVADIDVSAGEAVANSLDAARFVRADVSKDADVEAMVMAAEEHFGGLDILVNNAGWTHPRGALHEVSEADFDKVYATNVKSIYLGAVHGVPALKRRGGGVILICGAGTCAVTRSNSALMSSFGPSGSPAIQPSLAEP